MYTPYADGAEHLEEGLSRGLDDEEVLAKWVATFKHKLVHTVPWATEFLWERVIGKVPAKQELSGTEGEPVETIIRHVRVPFPGAVAR